MRYCYVISMMLNTKGYCSGPVLKFAQYQIVTIRSLLKLDGGEPSTTGVKRIMEFYQTGRAGGPADFMSHTIRAI